MERNWKVYKHTSPNGKVYIGITGQKLERRWRNGNGYKRCSIFWRAIEKYGWNNIEHEKMAEGLTKEEAEKMEIELISQYKSNRCEFGYNSASGGLANKPSKETKRKLSEINKGENHPMWGKHHSEETKKKISEAQCGEKNHMYGKTLSKEHKQK